MIKIHPGQNHSDHPNDWNNDNRIIPFDDVISGMATQSQSPVDGHNENKHCDDLHWNYVHQFRQLAFVSADGEFFGFSGDLP